MWNDNADRWYLVDRTSPLRLQDHSHTDFRRERDRLLVLKREYAGVDLWYPAHPLNG
jgi:hypothetical protein